MNKTSKFLILIGISLVFIAIVLTAGNIKTLVEPFYSDKYYDYTTYTSNNSSINKIIIDTNNDNINIYSYEGDSIRITYPENVDNNYTLTEEDNVISIKKPKRTFNFIWNFKFNFKLKSINVEIPEDMILAYDIKSVNARIELTNLRTKDSFFKTNNALIDFNNIKSDGLQEIVTNNAKINLDNIEVHNLIVTSDNGKIEADNIITDTITIETSNGRIETNNIIANKISYKTSNGKITFKDIKSNIIDLKTSNGKIEGNIIGNENDYQKNINTSNGKIIINNTEYGRKVNENNNSAKRLNAQTSNGSIQINFK